MKFGVTSFLETGINEKSGTVSHEKRINDAIEEIVLSDKLGLDFYGIGEHHRSDYASSMPEVILAAAAKLTKNIKLGSAVTVLSSSDPVRIYQAFSTIDLLTHGRAEVMAGRGSFTESFPLFGLSFNDYDDAFTETLDLLLNIKENEYVTHEGRIRPSINNLPVYPRSYDENLKISIAVGGTTSSVVRAAKLGLPIVFAVIGGEAKRFKPLINLYKTLYERNGHDLAKMEVSIHSHGFISEDPNIRDDYFKSHYESFKKIGEERSWGEYTYDHYINEIVNGSLYIGSVEEVSQKLAKNLDILEIDRFLLHHPGSYMPHDDVMSSLELFASKVVPRVKQLMKKQK